MDCVIYFVHCARLRASSSRRTILKVTRTRLPQNENPLPSAIRNGELVRWLWTAVLQSQKMYSTEYFSKFIKRKV